MATPCGRNREPAPRAANPASIGAYRPSSGAKMRTSIAFANSESTQFTARRSPTEDTSTRPATRAGARIAASMAAPPAQENPTISARSMPVSSSRSSRAVALPAQLVASPGSPA